MSKIKLSSIRPYVLIFSAVVVVLGFISEKGISTVCNFCPVGFLQITVASRSIPVDMIAGVGIFLVSVHILGRYFCSWLCPTTLIKSVLPKKRVNNAKYTEILPYLVLSLALIISFIVQFPIFCVVCPIGLFFGFLFAILKMSHLYEPSMNLIIFPAIIALELLLLKRWCSAICPIMAVFKLARKLPFIKYRMTVNQSTCLLSNGTNCRSCTTNCPEQISVLTPENDFIETCTNCLECKDKCPTKSIGFKK